MRVLLAHTLPGGTVVVTNVHKDNSTRYFMDYGGGWELIHRDEREMEELVPSGHNIKTYFDKARANIYMKISVPDGEK
jgi:hypothetical protein